MAFKDERKQETHVLLVAFSSQGHLNPMLRLGKCLASKGLQVTLATTEVARQKMLDSNNLSSTTTITNDSNMQIRLEFFSDGLSIDYDRKANLDHYMDSLSKFGPQNLSTLMDNFSQGGQQKFSCIINNPLVPWVSDVAAQHGIPCAMLWIQPCSLYAIYYRFYNQLNTFPMSTDHKMDVELPGLPLLHYEDLPSFVLPSNTFNSFPKLFSEMFKSMEKLKWVLGNSFYELEKDAIESMTGICPIIPIGPLVPSILLGNGESNDIGVDMWKPDETCITWLDDKPNSSVIYVSFGSIVVLSAKQMEELALGLRNSNRPFLWVVKPSDYTTKDGKGELPTGFLENIEGQGLVVKWCPQTELSMVVVCPWGFLGGSVPTQQQLKEAPLVDLTKNNEGNVEKRVSFADKVRGAQPQQLDLDSLPVPEMKGNMPMIKLPKQVVERGKLYCKYSLVGRLDFKKLNVEEVRRIAMETWKPKGDWKIIPLGKGFFMIRLTCEDDWRKIWCGGPWKFKDQTLRLSKWTPDFDPDVQVKSSALVWIKFPKLGQQYWDYEILMSMGRGLGSPVGVDKHTMQRDYGFFASVLVEVDLAKPIPNQILVEEDEHTSFLQEVEVEKLPKYCGHCKSVGHLVAECKALQKGFRREEAVVAEKQAEDVQKQKKNKRNRNKNKNVLIEPMNNVSVETMGTVPVEVPTTTTTEVVPIDVGTVDSVVEQQATEEDAQTQEDGIDHVDAIPQVGVAEPDVVALLPLAVEMQSRQPLNAPQAEVTATNCSLAVENFVSPTLCSLTHYIAPPLRVTMAENTIVPQENSRAADSYSPIARTMKSGGLEPDSSSTMRMAEFNSSSTTEEGNRLKLMNEANSLLRSVNWADLADDDENAEDGKEPWQKIAKKKYKPAWMSQEQVDDEDNSQDGDEPWQFQKEKGSKTKGKDVDLTPLPPRARKIPARYK